MKRIIIIGIVLLMFSLSCNNTNNNSNVSIVDSTIVDHSDIILQPNDTIDPSTLYIGEIVTLQELRNRSLYKLNCKFCHGEFGKGDGIKTRVNSNICPYDLTKEDKTDKFVYYVILNGRNWMPPYENKLDSNKINLLVIYIKKFREEK